MTLSRYRLAVFILVLLLSRVAGAEQPGPSWEGLTGLFTQPTADVLPRGSAAFTFSEIRFHQGSNDENLNSTWYTGTLTIVPLPGVELTATSRHEIVYFNAKDGTPSTPDLNDHLLIGNIKVRLLPQTAMRPGIAVGVMDITGTTATLDESTFDRGRRYFLVGSYRWGHAGVTRTDKGWGGFAGAQWRITAAADVIAEYVTDPVFLHTIPPPANKANFNLGVRFYPAQLPGLRVDVAAVGDGEFDFGFSFAYQHQF